MKHEPLIWYSTVTIEGQPGQFSASRHGPVDIATLNEWHDHCTGRSLCGRRAPLALW